jgi:hypothetical protein
VKVFLSAPGHEFQEGLLVLASLRGSSELPASIRNNVAEVPILEPEAFAVFVGNCKVRMLERDGQFTIPQLTAKSIHINEAAVSSGEVQLDLGVSRLLRVGVRDEDGRPLPESRISLVNTDQCLEFTTDEHAEAIVFEAPDQFRIAVHEHPRAKISIERLSVNLNQCAL